MNRLVATAATILLAGSAAWQAPVNARLGTGIGPVAAGAVSFVVSVLFLLLVACIVAGPGDVLRLPGQIRGVGLVNLTGGLIGATYVIVAVVTVHALGTGGLMAASVAGTLVGAVGIDWAGAVGVTRRVPDAGTIAGVLLLVAGTVFASGAGRFRPIETAAIFLAGVLVAFQPPVNARLALRLGGARAALTQSSIGMVFLIVVAAAAGAAGVGHPAGAVAEVPWWAWSGGLFGAAYVVSTLASVPVIGAGGVAAASIAGGMGFALAADALGMFGLDTVPFDLRRLVAVAMLSIGASLVLGVRRGAP